MQQQGDEKDNLTRIGCAILDEVQDAVRTVVDANIPNSLEDIFNKQQHKIYHYFSKECCSKCAKHSPFYRNRTILTGTQMEIVYTKSTIHPQQKLSFCCSTVLPGIELKKFDLSFLNAFLIMFPEFIYWPSCLSNQSKSFEDLLNDNKHKLYHLFDKNSCCYCPPGQQLSTDNFNISKQQFESLFYKQGSVSCINMGSPGHCICLFSAKILNEESLDDWLTYMILRICCPLKQSIEALVEVRNKVCAHACNSKLSNEDFKNNWCIIEEKVPELLNHGIVDKKTKEKVNREFIQRLKDLKVKPLTEESYRQVITALLRQNEIIQDIKELSENVQNLQSVAENTQAEVLNLHTVAENTHAGISNLQSIAENTQAGVLNFQSVAENTQTGVLNLQSVAQSIQFGVSNLQSLPGRVDGIEKNLTELLIRERNTHSDVEPDAVPLSPEDEPGSQGRTTNSDLNSGAEPYLPEAEPRSQDRNTISDLDTDAVPSLPEDEPGSQGGTTNSDLTSDAEPYLPEAEPRSQGAEAADRRDERSVDSEEQTYLKTGATGAEQTFRPDGYAYDTLVLHSEHDEEHVDDMIKMIKDKVALPDVKIATVGEDIPPGANLFDAFHNLMDASCSLLLFITPHFRTDCWSKYRLQTQLAHKMEDGPCVIPVQFGEEKITKEQLRDVGHLQSIIFFKEEDGDKYKSFIRKITCAIQQYRTKGNKKG